MFNKNKLFLLLFFSLSFIYFELLLRMVVVEHSIKTFSSGTLISIIFSISLSFLLISITSLFWEKHNFLISWFFLAFFGFIYSSQLVYHDIFKTFYTVYSATNATQVLEFWKDIERVIINNFLWILLLFVPTFFIIFFGRKIFSFDKTKYSFIAILSSLFLLTHIIGLTIINNGEKIRNSAYDLYYNNSSPILSIERLGLITTMRIDLKRLMTGRTPILEPMPISSNLNKKEQEKNKTKEEEEKENTEVVIERPKYNIMDIDFDTLIENENDETIRNMHKFFKETPATNKNDYTGKYEGYNLILITAEAFAPYGVDKELTPTLHKLVNEGYNFTDFYVPLWDVSTSDGEYVALNGLIPKSGVWSFFHSGSNHVPFVMGNQLKKLGYKTVAYHNHTYDYYSRDVSHPNMGYDYKGIGNGLNIKETWPSSDLDMLKLTIPEYITEEPFHAYYMTVSGHLQYNFIGNMMASKNKHYVEKLNLSEQAQAYLATQIELDKALEHLLEELDKAEVAEKTLIVLSADHYPYGLDFETINEFEGKEVEKNFEIYKSNLIIYTKNMEKITINKPTSSLDIIPTLSNLLGLEYDSRLLMGTDVFSDTDPFVLFRNGSFITQKGKYNALENKFYPNNEEKIEQEYIDYFINKVNEKFYYSSKILETDYYRTLFQ